MKDWLNKCHFGDVRVVLREMIAAGVKVDCIVTSPPYWGLRSYLPADHPDKQYEIGSEPTLRGFLETMVGVFDLAREVLADDGTLWMNMGDSYAGSGRGGNSDKITGKGADASKFREVSDSQRVSAVTATGARGAVDGFKPKDMMGQPHRLAFALQDAGWWLRQDIVWNKPNPMPESTRDRCTKAHEYIFLLAKSERYHYDFDAMQEPVNGGAHARRSIEHSNEKRPGFGHGFDAQAKPRYKTPDGWATHAGSHGAFHKDGREKGRKLAAADSGTKNNDSFDAALEQVRNMRNRRSVWTVPTEPYRDAHFATFPSGLIEPCVRAGCKPGGVVLDIFMGSGTTAEVAQDLGFAWIGIDIDPRNKALQDKRLAARLPRNMKRRQHGLVLE